MPSSPTSMPAAPRSLSLSIRVARSRSRLLDTRKRHAEPVFAGRHAVAVGWCVPGAPPLGYRTCRQVTARKDRRADAGKQFFRGGAHQGGIAERKAMIDREHDLPIN